MSNMFAKILQYTNNAKLLRVFSAIVFLYSISIVFYHKNITEKRSLMEKQAINEIFANRKAILDRGCAMIYSLRRDFYSTG